MKVLLTGRSGQLGQALVASAPDGVELMATSRAELDLADSAACCRIVEEQRPDWVLNAGAYTAVDHPSSYNTYKRLIYLFLSNSHSIIKSSMRSTFRTYRYMPTW